MDKLGIKIPARYILKNCSRFLGKEDGLKTPTLIRGGTEGYAVEVIDLFHEYENEVVALDGVTTRILSGSMTAIIGQNGSGKTTFAKHLCGLLKPTKEVSKIYVDSRPIEDYSTRELIQKINYVFQNPDDQIFSETVRHEIEYGLKNLGYSEEKRNSILNNVLSLFGLAGYVDMNPKFLRRGLRCKVAIASIVAMDPDILIVDEPTTGLDYRESLEIMDLLLRLNKEEGKTIVFITHDMDLVLRYADRVIVFNEGKILLEGSPKEVFKEKEILEEAWIDPPEIFQIAVEHGIEDLENIKTPGDLCKRVYGGGGYGAP
jgi:energy-coupling factor transporter ATP-binding protein EcfA2